MGDLEAEEICMPCMITTIVRIKQIQMIARAGWLADWRGGDQLGRDQLGRLQLRWEFTRPS